MEVSYNSIAFHPSAPIILLSFISLIHKLYSTRALLLLLLFEQFSIRSLRIREIKGLILLWLIPYQMLLENWVTNLYHFPSLWKLLYSLQGRSAGNKLHRFLFEGFYFSSTPPSSPFKKIVVKYTELETYHLTHF